MPAEVIDGWLQSGVYARVNGLVLKPVCHPQMPRTPLSIQRGQAEAFLLATADGGRWILKKFHKGRTLHRSYLASVSKVLPDHRAFASGKTRYLPLPRDLQRQTGFHYTRELAEWLDGTILIPRIDGCDWAAVADKLRDRSLQVDIGWRIRLCHRLTQTVTLLEGARCSHRDLSSSNLFINTADWSVSLIDFDSLFHPSLPMPPETTCGTEGYTAPYLWQQEQPNARISWCPHSDRYALGLLNIEFLVVDPTLPMTAEGGVFDQQELRARQGSGINLIRKQLQSVCAEAVPLMDSLIRSRSFEDCPPPEAWIRFCDSLSGSTPIPSVIPSLAEWPVPEMMPANVQPPAPIWPAPSLDEMPLFDMAIAGRPHAAPALPPDPWRP